MNYKKIIEKKTTTFGKFRNYDDSLLMIEPLLNNGLLDFEEVGLRRYPKKIGFLEDCVQASLKEMELNKPSLNNHVQNPILYLQNRVKLAKNGLNFHLYNEIVSRIPKYKPSNEINTNKLSLF